PESISGKRDWLAAAFARRRRCEFQGVHREGSRSGCLLKRDVPLQKEVDEVVADVGRLALLAVAVENLNDGLRKAEPRTSVLDEVVQNLVQRLPARFFHALPEPATRFQGEAGAEPGELPRSWRRILVAAAGEVPRQRQDHSRPAECVPAQAFPSRSAGGPGRSLALVRSGRGVLSRDCADAPRALRCAACAGAPDPACKVAQA